MNIKTYIKKKLEEDGYDGLFLKNEECYCFNDGLFPCEIFNDECRPGCKYKNNDEEYIDERKSIGSVVEKF